MSLQLLPYDLLFNIAQDLDIDDVHRLQAVSLCFFFFLQHLMMTYLPTIRPVNHCVCSHLRDPCIVS